MIVINIKRIKRIVLGVTIALFTFTFGLLEMGKTFNADVERDVNTTQTSASGVNEVNTTNSTNTLETTATPVSGKTVVLDAGHGVPDEGAQSSSRYNRSRNKFKDNIKGAKFIRAKWM